MKKITTLFAALLTLGAASALQAETDLTLDACVNVNNPTLLGRTINVNAIFEQCVDQIGNNTPSDNTTPVWQIPVTRLGVRCSGHPQVIQTGATNCNGLNAKMNGTFSLQYSVSDQTLQWPTDRLRINRFSDGKTNNLSFWKNLANAPLIPNVNLCPSAKQCAGTTISGYATATPVYLIDSTYRVAPQGQAAITKTHDDQQ